MRRLTLAIALLAATPVEAHCYSVWRYPWPQRCHATKPLHGRNEAPSLPKRSPFAAEPEMPLPGLARADLDGGAADEATRGRLLLRAALEAPDGH